MKKFNFSENKLVSTTENVSIFLYNSLKERMENPDLLLKVKVHETDKNSFVYRGDRTLHISTDGH